jgi:hypothetical protein
VPLAAMLTRITIERRDARERRNGAPIEPPQLR